MELASIHNEQQFQEAVEVCGGCKDKGAKKCWIGLVESSDGVNYEWTDGSAFDFGSDISGGVDPRGEGEPSYEWVVSGTYTVEEKCVVIWTMDDEPKTSKWKDVNCAYKRDFLCQRNKKEEPRSKDKHTRPPAPKSKGWPSAKPKPCPSDSPTAEPTTWPTTATLEPTPQTTSSMRTARPTILPPTSGRPTTPPTITTTTLEPTPSIYEPTAAPTPKPTPCGDAVCGIDEFCCTLGCSPRCLPIGRRCVAGC